MLELLEKYRFHTAWHLTDVSNLGSISKYGILSREHLQQLQMTFAHVGYDPIVETRSKWAKYALSFVTPYNKFIFGRIDLHRKQNSESLGLCLLEIDLQIAVKSQINQVMVSNGLLSKITSNPYARPLKEFPNVFDWHALLDPGSELTSKVEFARGSEILFPNVVPTSAIRHVWLQDAVQMERVQRAAPNFNFKIGSQFLINKEPLPKPALNNFSGFEVFKRAVPIYRKDLGRGEIVGQLGDFAVIDFESAAGRQLLRFGDYEWV